VRKSIYTFPQQQLIQLLREVRQEAGLTQMQLAERLGVLQSEVSNWERGEKRLDLIELCQIVDAIGISLHAFVARFESRAGRQ
jgi:transcriptional regulator with XRE-family HTH domain